MTTEIENFIRLGNISSRYGWFLAHPDCLEGELRREVACCVIEDAERMLLHIDVGKLTCSTEQTERLESIVHDLRRYC